MLNRVGPSLVAFALAACAEAAETLNSERIEAEFGNFGIDVISYRDGLRRASLYSSHDDGKTTRTYAIVHFDDVTTSLRDSEHARILAGASIGATFKSAGWSIDKQSLYIGTLNPGADVHGILPLMRLPGPRDLAMHVYRLHIKKGIQEIDYATIIELHHPAYMSRDRLCSIFGSHVSSDVDDERIAHWRSLVLEDRHEHHVVD